jgi:predicted amidohydrolase
MKTLKIAAIQLNLVQCESECHFYNILDKLVSQAVREGAEVIAFPEDLGFCLAWAKESFVVSKIRKNEEKNLEILSTKSYLEKLFDFLISKIKLNKMGEWLSQKRISDIIKRVFKKLAIQNKVIIISGSVYESKFTGIYNMCYIYEPDGRLAGSYAKRKLVPIEISWGVKSGTSETPIKTSKADIGLVICYDLDDSKFIKKMCDNGAQFIVAPSGGWRPYPDYPFDKNREQPQIQRSIENNISIIRPYCCGWLFPGLYFQGHTQIVDQNGNVITESLDWSEQKIFYADIALKTQILK